MAITVNSFSVYPSGFAVNGTSADASGCEELKAAPDAGNCIYLSGLIISSASALTVTIGAGEDSGAVESAVIGPIALAANQTLPFKFANPIMLPDGKSLTVDASGAGVVTVYAEGMVDVSRIPS
jgi:hypothetical protein